MATDLKTLYLGSLRQINVEAERALLFGWNSKEDKGDNKMSEREILDQLIAKGKITEEDISELLTPTKKELVEIVHLLMCYEDHDMSDPINPKGKCQWYPEEQLDTAWKRVDHLKWIKISEQFLRDFKLGVNRAVNDLEMIRLILGNVEKEGLTKLLAFILSSDSTKFIPEGRTKDFTGSSDDSSLSS